ncbi:MAG: DNA double-strand break repair nuclease NurA [Candidatus Woesearchaeota archaeon]
MKEIVEKFVNVYKETNLVGPCEETVDLREAERTFKISEENFHEFKAFDNTKKMIFVDGGNAELINTTNISVHFIRTYGSVFESKRIYSIKKENYMIAYATRDKKNSEIYYKVEFSPSYFDFQIDSFEESLREGNNRIPISKIGDVTRRLCELKTALHLSKKFSDSIILLDGNLKSNFQLEKNLLQELFDSGIKNKNIIAALSKTSQLLTKNGRSVNNILMRTSKSLGLLEWYYYPIAKIRDENHKAEIVIVKLHKKSNYCFNFEIFNEQADNIDEVLWHLKKNSKDPSFFGYPYGLIDADRFARISNKEKDFLKTLLLTRIPKNISKDFVLNDSHDLLNKLIK